MSHSCDIFNKVPLLKNKVDNIQLFLSYQVIEENSIVYDLSP